jgi:uncharacterized membrane protein YphA (DoxX/SURF4 family)
MKTTLGILHWLSRCLLAAIFIYSGLVKCCEILIQNGHFQFHVFSPPLQFAMAIQAYKLAPQSLIFPLATYLPWFEVALGIVLLSGWKIRYSAFATSGLLLFFIIVLTITYARGIEANCGCGFFSDRISPKSIARDSLMLLPAVFLIFESRFRSRLAKPASTSA